MIGTLKFSSRITYGRNKRNIPYFLFTAPNLEDNIVVSSKQGCKTNIDNYAIIEIINSETTPMRGALIKLIGPVNDYQSSYNYILHKYNVISSNCCIQLQNSNEINQRLDLTHLLTYSIDPEGCQDIDDAFSYDDDIIYIHITDLTCYKLNQIEILSNISSTFYTPEKNYNMLDEIISHNESSLLEGQERDCITMIVQDDIIEFKQTTIIVDKNLTYDDEIDNQLMNKLNVNDTHELIEKLMIMYNHNFAKHLNNLNIEFPIRIHKGIKEQFKNCSLREDLIRKLCFESAVYQSSTENEIFHYGLELEYYTHATSPLRRFIDIVNQHILIKQTQFDITTICNSINERNKQLKACNRDLIMLNLLNQDIEYEYDAIITNFNECIVNAYIEDLDISVPVIVISNKIKDVFNFEINDNNLIITKKSDNSIMEFQLLEQIRIKTMITPNESSLNRKIRFYLL